MPAPLSAHSLLRPVLFAIAASIPVSWAIGGCKRSEPPPDLIKTQRDAMERAKDVGKTMQKGVDQEAKKADEEGR